MTVFPTTRGDVPVLDRAAPLILDPDVLNSTGYLLPVDKSKEWTSFDVVARVRNVSRVRKVGHAGTLDPLATGLLILCLGRATKIADEVQAERKEYTGTIRLGELRTTDDTEGDVVASRPFDHVSDERVVAAARTFLGRSEQVPPMFSARKVRGKRLYKLAREGQIVERGASEIDIDEFDVIDVRLPDIRFRLLCSKGTYVRSIARDFGERLDSVAYLADLRRTGIGDFRVEGARTVDEIVRELSAAAGN